MQWNGERDRQSSYSHSVRHFCLCLHYGADDSIIFPNSPLNIFYHSRGGSKYYTGSYGVFPRIIFIALKSVLTPRHDIHDYECRPHLTCFKICWIFDSLYISVKQSVKSLLFVPVLTENMWHFVTTPTVVILMCHHVLQMNQEASREYFLKESQVSKLPIWTSNVV